MRARLILARDEILECEMETVCARFFYQRPRGVERRRARERRLLGQRGRRAHINDNSKCHFARRFHADELVITDTPVPPGTRCIHSRRRQRNIFSWLPTINPLSRLRFMTDTSYFNRHTNRLDRKKLRPVST